MAGSSGPEFPDARRAAIADQVEAQLVQVILQAGSFEISGHYSQAGASEFFTFGLTVSPFSTAFLASNPAASITLGSKCSYTT